MEITFNWEQAPDKPFAGRYAVNPPKAIAEKIGTPKEEGWMFELSDKGDTVIQMASEAFVILPAQPWHVFDDRRKSRGAASSVASSCYVKPH